MTIIEQAAALAEGLGAWGGGRMQTRGRVRPRWSMPVKDPDVGAERRPWGGCPPGWDLYYILSDHMGNKQVWGPMNGNEIVPVGGHWDCAPKGSMTPQGGFTATEAFRRARMQQVQYGTQASSGPYLPPRPQAGGLHGAEENMNLIEQAAGLGALFNQGLGVLGPYGNDHGPGPSGSFPSGTYEISGTGVAFRSAPNLGASTIGTFNPDTSRGDVVVGTPDQVAFNGETASGSGLNWAKVQAKNLEGYVATEYLAPVGWTAKQGKTTPKGGGGGGGIEPAKQETSTTTETDYTPYILGGAAVLGGGIILWAVLAKPKKGGVKHRRRAHA